VQIVQIGLHIKCSPFGGQPELTKPDLLVFKLTKKVGILWNNYSRSRQCFIDIIHYRFYQLVCRIGILFFLAALAYLQYQQIANINWDKLQTISGDAFTTFANATQQIPGFDGNGNVPVELIMTNLGIPLTGSLAIGFTIGFMRG
jgi:uncharacterized membrane protein (Fun14 family)